MLRFTVFDEPRSYRDAVGALLADEARNNLLIGVLDGLVERGWQGKYAGPPLLAAGYEGDRPVLLVVRTPPHNVLLGDGTEDAVRQAAQWLAERGVELPGVLAPVPVAEVFAGAWAKLTGKTPRLHTALRTHELTRVTAPTGVEGRFRAATKDDAELLAEWVGAFADEIRQPRRDAAGFVRWSIEAGAIFVWDDGRPVAMATCGDNTPHGVRVGYVYTPPAYRRRGYASALVAALSQHLLDGGRRLCFLFTDLGNPTSNHIYHVIGYRPVCDFAEYHFAARA